MKLKTRGQLCLEQKFGAKNIHEFLRNCDFRVLGRFVLTHPVGLWIVWDAII